MIYDEDSISSKSQFTALVLFLLLGSFGAHRFYVRKYITGVFYCILGSTSIIFELFGYEYTLIAKCIFMLFMIVDLYALYSDSFTDKDGKLVIGKDKYTKYETYQERDQIVFDETLKKILLVFIALAVYILYYVIVKFII